MSVKATWLVYISEVTYLNSWYPEHSYIKKTICEEASDVICKEIKIQSNHTAKKNNNILRK